LTIAAHGAAAVSRRAPSAPPSVSPSTSGGISRSYIHIVVSLLQVCDLVSSSPTLRRSICAVLREKRANAKKLRENPMRLEKFTRD
jgi:hypothetical protein